MRALVSSDLNRAVQQFANPVDQFGKELTNNELVFVNSNTGRQLLLEQCLFAVELIENHPLELEIVLAVV